jgi:hypothetical protein
MWVSSKDTLLQFCPIIIVEAIDALDMLHSLVAEHFFCVFAV